MYAVPRPDAFKVTLNSETDVFFGVTDPDPELDVVSVDAPVQSSPSEVETFTIDFIEIYEGATIIFSWDQILITVPATIP